MSHDEPASQPSHAASSAAQPQQNAERPSTQLDKHGEPYGRGPALYAAALLLAFNRLPADERRKAIAAWIGMAGARMISSSRYMR